MKIITKRGKPGQTSPGTCNDTTQNGVAPKIIQSVLYMASAAFASAKAPSFVLFPVFKSSHEHRTQSETHRALTANETTRMNKYSTIYTRRLGHFIIPETPPRLRQGFSAFETFRGHGDGLDAIVSASFVSIDYIDRFCVLRNAQFCFQLEEVFLYQTLVS